VIHGFSADITLHIDGREETLLEWGGFYRFAEILVKPGPNGEKGVGASYAFAVNADRKSGIYQRISLWSEFEKVITHDINYEWYCETFLEWLSQVVDAQGRLPMKQYEGR